MVDYYRARKNLIIISTIILALCMLFVLTLMYLEKQDGNEGIGTAIIVIAGPLLTSPLALILIFFNTILGGIACLLMAVSLLIYINIMPLFAPIYIILSIFIIYNAICYLKALIPAKFSLYSPKNSVQPQQLVLQRKVDLLLNCLAIMWFAFFIIAILFSASEGVNQMFLAPFLLLLHPFIIVPLIIIYGAKVLVKRNSPWGYILSIIISIIILKNLGVFISGSLVEIPFYIISLLLIYYSIKCLFSYNQK